MKKPYKIIFLGTPNFATFGLEKLIKDDFFKVLAIFTQEDKPQGRSKEIIFSPVKKIANKYNIKCYQPKRIKDDLNKILDLKADLIVVIAYGQILPLSILQACKFGAINLHASLLPLYRGASCLAAPILNGDKYSGVTVMKMDEGMDTGDILSQEKIELKKDETLLTLHDRLAKLGSDLLIPTLKKYLKNELKPIKQNNKLATYVKLTKKEDGRVNWQESAEVIERKFRAYFPWPGLYCFTDKNEMLKLIEIKISDEKKELKAGEVMIKDKKIIIGTLQGNILILKLQKAGQKIMTANEFINGHNIDKTFFS